MLNVTPTQRAAIDRRNAFNAKLDGFKPQPKVIPITQAEPVSAPINIKVVWSATSGWPNYKTTMQFAPGSKKRRTIPQIVAAVAAYFEMNRDELLSDRRTNCLVMPRHVAMYLAHVHTMQSTTAIGRALGGRDHTTVIHGLRSIQSRVLFRDPLVINALDEIANMLSIEL